MNIKNCKCDKNSNKLAVVISIVINTILAIVFICLMDTYFESNDDAGMSSIVEGLYGEKNARIIFINVFIGKILKILYSIIPLVKWYTVFQYIGLFFAFTFFTYILLKHSFDIKRIFLILMVLIPFSYECYVKLQFTKTAGILVAIGILGLFFSLRYKEEKLLYIISAFFVISGSMYRFQSFLIVSAVMCILGIYELIEINKKEAFALSSFLKKSKGYFMVFGVVFCMVFVLYMIDRLAYIRDDGWNYYLEYNDARYKIFDYTFPDWDSHRSEYEKMGYSKEDIEMYCTWTFADFDKFTKEDMRKIYALNDARKLTWDTVEEYIKDLPFRMLKMPMIGVVIFALIYYFFFCQKRKWYILGYLFFVEFVSYFYFYYKGRYEHINRIDVVFLYAIICVILFIINCSTEKIFQKSKLCMTTIGIICLCSVIVFSSLWYIPSSFLLYLV